MLTSTQSPMWDLNFNEKSKQYMISNTELKSIKKKLPDFRKILTYDETYIENGIYKKLFISVFDHWLTNEEANKLIFINNDKDELKKRREKFEKIIEDFYKTTEIYLWKYKRNYRVFIQKPLTYNDLLKKCDFNNLWSESVKRYGLIMPEFSAIYNEEWDWTNIIWYTDEIKIKPILKIAEKAGLHILK